MLPVISQAVEALRGDENNPIHALDGWVLARIEDLPPSSVRELAISARLRMGPGGRGPELEETDALVRWVRDATERGLIEAEGSDDPSRPRWRLTDRGRARLGETRGVKRRIGAGLGWAVRMPSVWGLAVERIGKEGDVETGPPPPKRVGLPPITRSPGDETSAAQALENLRRVNHIVVLMMENRSFDHMLGYLDLLDGQSEVRGLSQAKPIRYEGKEYAPAYLRTTAFPKSMDPPHGRREIAGQINGGAMDGFIEVFAREKDVGEPERVMGYYTHRELPVYDHFAHRFLLCDQWFSSVPSATWPNRLFSIAGNCDAEREGLFDGDPPFYELKSFVRLLADSDSTDTWRWYSWDPGSLRFVDKDYRLDEAAEFHHEHFRRVAQHALDPGIERQKGDDPEIRLGSGFLEDAANGDLPRVSWIDPNFIDLSILDPNSNDDHPPSDVRAGQELVMLVYRALAESPCWEDTMLVVTYDEHGGFFDHEPPPRPPEANPKFPTYGVRVPAFVVSPFVEPATVSHTVFDHASIVRTVLERFGVEGAVEQMPTTAPRVAEAEHLGRLLTRMPAPGERPPDLALPNAALEGWRHGRANRRSAAAEEIGRRSREAAEWRPENVTGFPADFLDGARTLRESGLPAGHP